MSGLSGIMGDMEAKLAAERRERARLREALDEVGRLARYGGENALVKIQGVVMEALGLQLRR